jgi:hypothetical protein
MTSTIKITTITNIDKPEYKYIFKTTGDFRRRFKLIQYAINKFQTKPQRCFEKLNSAFIELGSDWNKWYVCDSVNCKPEEADSVLYSNILTRGTLNEGYLRGANFRVERDVRVQNPTTIHSSRSVSTQTTQDDTEDTL